MKAPFESHPAGRQGHGQASDLERSRAISSDLARDEADGHERTDRRLEARPASTTTRRDDDEVPWEVQGPGRTRSAAPRRCTELALKRAARGESRCTDSSRGIHELSHTRTCGDTRDSGDGERESGTLSGARAARGILLLGDGAELLCLHKYVVCIRRVRDASPRALSLQPLSSHHCGLEHLICERMACQHIVRRYAV